ncbi:HET-domain-containing protein [Zopfia rhizophila CBS 207.26]|uniref:HET-domain-containing protein n=1 Tax=Zopfia rhizophila CBS 207.26 TaxID=1314779 RepID=A0A6A6E3I4_9PEZI|nr:HET-domain-containing protein [Zopfia rhizophila CBS 207.26]
MDDFKYEPIDLEGPAFRLLRLFKGRESDIECELFQAWLYGDSAISYEALSYTWGGTEMTEHVKINGRRLGVTINLYLALQHLRFQDLDRILWVDAICIDQSNKKERGHQVQQMRDIYNQADKVIFWLGPATYETNVVMDSLKRLHEESIKYTCKDWKLTDKRWIDLWLAVQPILRSQHLGLVTRQHAGMESLLERPWFKRVWILQEVANARAAVVCSGAKSVSARIFALGPLLIGVQPEPHCQAVLDIMPGPSRNDSWWSQKRDLYTLLLKFKGSKASDQRDMIYAFLSISSDAHDIDNLRADYTKTAQQVVYEATSFLFDLSDFPYHTMPRFLCNFTSLNTEYLCRVVKSYDANNVASFLKRRGDEVAITKEVVKAAAGNTRSGKEVMTILLEQRGGEVKVTEEVVEAAAGNTQSGKEVMALLLEQRGGEVKVTEEVVKAAVGNTESGKEVMTLLLEQRGDEVKVTEEVVKAAAGNTESGKEVIALLLEQRVEGFNITPGLVTELARLFSARSMALLLKRRRDAVYVTEEMVKAAAGNTRSGKEVMALLLEQRGGEVKVTEDVVIAAAGNTWSGKEVMALLLKQRAEGFNITLRLVTVLARLFSARFMALLSIQRGGEVKVIEEVVKAIVRNTKSGVRVIALLLKQRRDKVKITEEVIKAAAGNTESGKEVMTLFLEQRTEGFNITLELITELA